MITKHTCTAENVTVIIDVDVHMLEVEALHSMLLSVEHPRTYAILVCM